jgi:hypothetical protein
MHHSLIDSWDINAYFTWVLRKIRREIASDNDRVVATDPNATTSIGTCLVALLQEMVHEPPCDENTKRQLHVICAKLFPRKPASVFEFTII